MRLPDPDDIVEIQPLDLTPCFPLSALREPETTFLLEAQGPVSRIPGHYFKK